MCKTITTFNYRHRKLTVTVRALQNTKNVMTSHCCLADRTGKQCTMMHVYHT